MVSGLVTDIKNLKILFGSWEVTGLPKAILQTGHQSGGQWQEE